MSKNITILVLLISSLLNAQIDLKVIKEDFDGDGNIEELIVNSYLGEVDFALLTYESGLKRCTLNIRPQKNHPSLINTVPLCNDLLLPKYKRITQFVDSIIFNSPASKSLDPTLGWVLDVYSSKKLLKDHPYFTSYARFKPKIKKTYYEAPTPHRLLVKGKLVKKINKMHEKCDTTIKSWITFDANRLTRARQITEFNLEPVWPQFIDSVGTMSMNKTGHSVYLEKDTAHQVIFVSDGVLFQNLQKLEWESIQEVQPYKNYFLILTHPYPAIANKLFLVDYKKGYVFEFRNDVLMDYDNYYHNIESFEMMEDELFLFLRESPQFDEIKEKSIPFILIKESIKAIGK